MLGYEFHTHHSLSAAGRATLHPAFQQKAASVISFLDIGQLDVTFKPAAFSLEP